MWKRRMKMRVVEEEEDEYLGPDRLSSLPDTLLILIFSFLGTKQAIQACFTLKKWVNLWTLLPNLNFTTSGFKNLRSFDKFVDKVLTLRDGSVVKINNFTYHRAIISFVDIPNQIAKCKLERIVNFIVSHEVQDLTFSAFFNEIESSRLLDRLGSCATITSLKLGHMSLGCTLCLKQVVTLYLDDVALRKEETFSGCQNLKNLTLVGCFSRYRSRHLDSISVIAPQLSRLTINDSTFACGEVKLSTQRLTSLKIIVGSSVPLLKSDDLVVLDTVDVFVLMRQFDQSKNLQQFPKLISMLKCFHNAKSVTLSSDTIKLLSMFPDELEREPSPFCNLKLLSIVRLAVAIPGHVMTYLLGKSPHATTVVKLSR